MDPVAGIVKPQPAGPQQIGGTAGGDDRSRFIPSGVCFLADNGELAHRRPIFTSRGHAVMFERFLVEIKNKNVFCFVDPY